MQYFPNQVPRFTEKSEAIEFMKRYCRIGSNPEEPHLRHSISTLTDWDQIEKYLLPKIHEYNTKWPPKLPLDDAQYKRNKYMPSSASAPSPSSSSSTSISAEEYETEKAAAVKKFLKELGWRQYFTDDGENTPYYFEKSTKTTQYKKPKALRTFLSDYEVSHPAPSDTKNSKDGGSGTVKQELIKHQDTDKTSKGQEQEEELEAKGLSTTSEGVYAYMKSRFDLPIHRTMTRHSTLNTLSYLYHHMRCGIFVMIRNNQVAIFCPFVNKDYRNNWEDVEVDGEKSKGLELDSKDGSVSAYVNMLAGVIFVCLELWLYLCCFYCHISYWLLTSIACKHHTNILIYE